LTKSYQRYQPSTKQETRLAHQYQKSSPVNQPTQSSQPNKYDKYNTKKATTKTSYEKKEVVRTLGEGGNGGFDDFPDFDFGFGSSSGGGSGDKQVVSEKRSEKVTIEGGKKKKIITIERVLADGSKESETLIED
jgi:hypothetical protein